MKKVLFICHGNICRSPMAEYVMKDMVKKAGKGDEFFVASAAMHTDELGNPVYPPVRKLLNAAGIDCNGHAARLIRDSDYADFDLIIGMDEANIRDLYRKFHGDPEGKIHKLLEYCGLGKDVADPWYTRDFSKTWDEINAGCAALLGDLTGK
ncbi:MAG: low molecular weight phosphotyrosine protein phosphatase [Lachnospiraceae bacterium]|nr:low molecular weight phosphotyrosine protein phosphatase [Lachnospiraceae bacterium]